MIAAVGLEGRSKSEVARDYGVSRRWVQALVARYLIEGEAAVRAPVTATAEITTAISTDATMRGNKP